MIDTKEKLVKLLLYVPPVDYGTSMSKEQLAEHIAYWLINNGVTANVQCKDCANATESLHYKGQLNCPMWGAAGLNPYGYCHMWKQKEN